MITYNELLVSDWFLERPATIQAAIREKPPTSVYWLRSSGHLVTIYSYSEDDPVTVTVSVTCALNPVLAFERNVFGVPLSNLVELPSGVSQRCVEILESGPQCAGESESYLLGILYRICQLREGREATS